MLRIVLLVFAAVCIVGADYQVDLHQTAVDQQISSGQCDPILAAYDCSGALHAFHFLDEVGLACLFGIAFLSLFFNDRFEFMGMIWVMGLVLLLVVTSLGIVFEFVSGGIEQQSRHAAFTLLNSLFVTEFLDMAAVAVFVVLLVLGRPEKLESSDWPFLTRRILRMSH